MTGIYLKGWSAGLIHKGESEASDRALVHALEGLRQLENLDFFSWSSFTGPKAANRESIILPAASSA